MNFKFLRKWYFPVFILAAMLLSYLVAIVHHEASVELAYNYKNFSASQYKFSRFEGPTVGQKAVDFLVTDLDGNEVKLSQFFGKTIVLETGSVTCAQYTSRVLPMNRLAEQYPDVTFLLLYVREAHPGASYPAHQSIDQKRDHAFSLTQVEPENRMILVDDLNGTAHQQYGSWPNMIYLIDEEGVIRFRGKWNDAEVTSRVLDAADSGKPFDVAPQFSPVAFSENLRVANRAGEGAFVDWLLGIPGTVVGHAIEEIRGAEEKSAQE